MESVQTQYTVIVWSQTLSTENALWLTLFAIFSSRFKDRSESYMESLRAKQSKADCIKMKFDGKMSGINVVLLSGRGESRQNCLGLEISALKVNEKIFWH